MYLRFFKRHAIRKCGGLLMKTQAGFLLIEVLVSILIIAFGMLGMVALLSRFTIAEMESYQRGQALIILQDITERLRADAANAASYADLEIIGADADEDCTATGHDVAGNACHWGMVLKGASEKVGENAAGAMLGARTCITAAGNDYTVAVVWQGLAATAVPSSTLCGQGQYGNEALRRAVTATLLL